MDRILGIHSIVAVAADFKRTLDFYDRVLGLSPVAEGRAGSAELGFVCGEPYSASASVLSFHKDKLDGALDRRSRPLTGLVFGVALGSLPAWRRRLDLHDAKVVGTAWAFGCEYLCVTDPNGVELALVEEAAPDLNGARAPRPHRLRSVEVEVGESGARIHRLVAALGFMEVGREGPLTRFSATDAAQPIEIDVLQTSERNPPRGINRGLLAVMFSMDGVVSLGRLAARLTDAGFELQARPGGGRFTIIGSDDWGVVIGAASVR